MNVIYKGNQELLKIIDNIYILDHNKLAISKYVAIYNYEEKKSIIFFNTFTRKIVELSNREYFDLKVGLESHEMNYVVNAMFMEKMLVPDSLDDNALYNDIREIFVSENHQEFNGYEIYVIFTTTVCNARCFYCFERNTKHVTMDSQTAEDVAKFIIKTRNTQKPVCLHWFGGEPLCNIAAIDVICNYLESKGISYTSRFTTNASIFNSDIITRAVCKWKTNRVQITLDGTEEEHNKRKNYVNADKYNFKNTIENIFLLESNGVHVTIRLNCDANNIDNMKLLVTQLCDKFRGHNKIFIDPHPIFNCDNNENILNVDSDFYNKIISLENLTSEFNLINNDEVKKNSANAIDKFRLGSCQSVSMRIAPDGNLYPCQHIDQVASYGNIYDGIIDEQMYEVWRTENHHQTCIECTYRPLCACLEFCNANRDKCKIYADMKYKSWVFDICSEYYNLHTYIKLSKQYRIYTILDKKVAIEFSGINDDEVKNILKMNDVSYFMWKHIENGITKQDLIRKVMSEYDIDYENVANAVCNFTEYLYSNNIISK